MDLKTALEFQNAEDKRAFARQIETIVRTLAAHNVAEANYISLNHRATNATREAAELMVIAGRIEANERVLLTLAEDNEPPCPGCGCKAGDGRTPGCMHPDGCGYWEGMQR